MYHRTPVISLLAILVSTFLLSPAQAQHGVALLCPDANGPGGGWGVGYVDAMISPESVFGPLSVHQVQVTSPDHRVFYPSFAYTAPDPKTKEILTERAVLPPFVRGIVRNAMDNAQPRCRIFFLFKGNQPLRIDVGTNPPMSFVLQVERSEYIPPQYVPQTRQEARMIRRESRYYRLLNQWLTYYFSEVNQRDKVLSPQPPEGLKNYLRAMLVYRLGLDPQAIAPTESPWDSVSPFNFSGTTPKLRSQMAYVSFFEDSEIEVQSSENQEASSKNTKQSTENIENNNSDPQSSTNPDTIEPIALHVPKNCVYIRFGSFKNFQWFQELNESVQGDMANLFSSQSLDRNNTAKMQTLLASRMTEMSKLMGPAVIQDVAFIGTDMFTDDGPSFGMLFHATNSLLLSTGLNGERATYLDENPDAKEKTVKVAGKKVSYLYTPDGRIHSYYAVDGMFHLITTSRKIVELFYETQSDKSTALGNQEYFAQARTTMPLNKKYTVFFYASEDFMRQFISPEYWTELMRRRRSVAEIEMVYMARQAAKNEGLQSDSIEDLVKYGFLPNSVLYRPDGSKLQLDDKGKVYDTKRGYPGLFRPIVDMILQKDDENADIPTVSMSKYESSQYELLLDSFQNQKVQITPIMVGVIKNDAVKSTVSSQNEENRTVKQEASEENNNSNKVAAHSILDNSPNPETHNDTLPESKTSDSDLSSASNATITFEAHIAPFYRTKLEKFKSYFGPADNVRFAPIVGSCIQAQFVLNNSRLLIGLRNDIPPERSGHLVADILGGIFGNDLGLYFVTTNQSGFFGLLGTFNIAPMGPPAEYTIHSTPDMNMRYRDQQVKLFSPIPTIPPQVAPYLSYELAPTPQHGWISIHDPMSVPIGWRINDMCYAASARTSFHNLILLQVLIQQLGVAPADALSQFESLTSAKLVSPIGGKYEFQPVVNNFGYWTDTALGNTTVRNLGWFSVHAPQGYMSAPWTWFRGSEIQFKVEPEKVIITGTIEYQE